MKKETLLREESGSGLTGVFLVTFVFAAIALCAFQIRKDLKQASAFAPEKMGQHEAWVRVERFFKDNISCTLMLKGKKLGDTLLGGGPKGAPQVGHEWQKSGWILKDMYLVRKEDEVAWEMKKVDQRQIFLKLSLIPKPRDGLKMNVEYMLNAPTSVKLIPVKVSLAEERIFESCHKTKALGLCHQTAYEKRVLPKIQLGRAPASVDNHCPKGINYQVHCLIPADDAPIWSCIN